MNDSRLSQAQIREALGEIAEDTTLGELQELLPDDIPKALESLTTEYYSRIASTAPLAAGETIAVSMDAPMVAALCFDRVWWGAGLVPPSIGFGGLHRAEVQLVGVVDLATSKLNQLDLADLEPRSKVTAEKLTDRLNMKWTTGVSRLYDKALGLDVCPIFSSAASRHAELRAGSHSVAIASMHHIGLADETTLDWQQVIEFRQDRDSLNKYRRMIHWLDKELADRDQQFVEAEISRRLEDYEWALRKHGISTVLGTLSEILNPKWLTGVTVFGALTSYSSGNPVAGVAVAAATTVGRVSIAIARTALLKEDIRQANRDIALVYELKNRQR
ncbi:MAG: hypothetical protein WBC51_12295 [Vicinamibacterales bacterium]